jgi:hypothetical protein
VPGGRSVRRSELQPAFGIHADFDNSGHDQGREPERDGNAQADRAQAYGYDNGQRNRNHERDDRPQAVDGPESNRNA